MDTRGGIGQMVYVGVVEGVIAGVLNLTTSIYSYLASFPVIVLVFYFLAYVFGA